MVDTLKDIFDNVNSWLKFAEAKNATLVGGNGLIIFGILKIIGDKDIPQYWLFYIYFSLLLIAVSMIMALITFMPKLKTPMFLLNDQIEKGDNLLFFGHILKYNERVYLQKISEATGKENDNNLNAMYAQQIIINSKIAMLKFSMFNIAIKFTIAGLVSPILYFIIKEMFIEKDIRKKG